MSQPDILLKAWGDYMANCHTMISQLSSSPFDAPGVAPMPFAGAWRDLAKSFGISMDTSGGASIRDHAFSNFGPAFGATREYQQIAQRMLELSVQFHRQYEALVTLGEGIQDSAQRSINAQSASMASAAADPGAAYDAWIDGAEEAYAQVAQSEVFARALGEMVNVLSKFKVERGKLQEAVARALDLPSRSEVDTLHRQVRDLTLALRSFTGSHAPAPNVPKRRKAAKP